MVRWTWKRFATPSTTARIEPTGRLQNIGAELEAIGRDLEGGLEARTLLLKDALINGQYDPNLEASLVKHRNDWLSALVKCACQFE